MPEIRYRTDMMMMRLFLYLVAIALAIVIPGGFVLLTGVKVWERRQRLAREAVEERHRKHAKRQPFEIEIDDL